MMKSVEAKYTAQQLHEFYTSVYDNCCENSFANILPSSTFVLFKLPNYEAEPPSLWCYLNVVLFNWS